MNFLPSCPAASSASVCCIGNSVPGGSAKPGPGIVTVPGGITPGCITPGCPIVPGGTTGMSPRIGPSVHGAVGATG